MHNVITSLSTAPQCWRVEWNAAGSVLASAGDDGYARLRRADVSGTWHLVAQLQVSSALSGLMVAATNLGALTTPIRPRFTLAV